VDPKSIIKELVQQVLERDAMGRNPVIAKHEPSQKKKEPSKDKSKDKSET
jgi:hypothetical protein